LKIKIYFYLCTVDYIHLHIAYLLTKHECVVIPHFGALIVSEDKSDKSGGRNILSPSLRFLGFNSEITHNDGLLANSIAKAKKIDYKEALSLVQQFSANLFDCLDKGQTVQIPWIGKFSLSKERKVLFFPAPNLSCNADLYGFANVRLPYLSELKNPSELKAHPHQSSHQSSHLSRRKKKPDIIWIPLSKKVAYYAASTAAVFLAMFFIPTPLNNYPQKILTQSASMSPFPSKVSTELILSETETANLSVDTTRKIIVVDTISKIIPADNIIATNEQLAIQQPKITKPHKEYFIVVASLSGKELAEIKLKDFVSEGFDKAVIRSSEEKHRIIIRSFLEKSEAELFLIRFRKDYPSHSKAWLLIENI